MVKKKPSPKKPGPDSVDQLVQRLRTDKTLRYRLMSGLAETLEGLGVKSEDISLIPALDIVSDDFAGRDPAQIVIIHRDDSKKNSKSIIIGGKRLTTDQQ